MSLKQLKFCHHLLTLKLFQSCMNIFLLLLNTKEDILKNVSNQTLTSIVGEKKKTMEQQGPINCLLTDILQNIFSCVQQKKETHTGLKQLEG